MVMSRHLRVHLVGFLALASHAFLVPQHRLPSLQTSTNKHIRDHTAHLRSGWSTRLFGWQKWTDNDPGIPPGPDQPLSWSTGNDGRIYYTVTGRGDAERFTIKGINWFGFEDPNRVPHTYQDYNGKDFVREVAGLLEYHHFNAVRLPVSLGFALDLDSNEYLRTRLDNVIRGLAEKNILVLLDMHRVYEGGPDASTAIFPMWWSDEVPEWKFVQGWDILLKHTKKHWNVFGVDLKNEPHNTDSADFSARWEGTDVSIRSQRSWNLFATELANHIIKWHPDFKGLIFVEGVQDNKSEINPYNAGWGASVKGFKEAPIKLNTLWSRLVLSPHVYGPSVWHGPDYGWVYNEAESQKAWTYHWAFVRDNQPQQAVVVGEWGGKCDTVDDQNWHNNMILFLKAKNLVDQFYWCLNPDSGDTGGFLADRTWWDHSKPSKDWRINDFKRGLLERLYQGISQEYGRELFKIGPDGRRVEWTRPVVM